MVNYRFLKGKAGFMIFIFIFSIVYFSYSFKEVNALIENKVCCERTKTGEFCSYTKESLCDEKFNKANSACEQTSFCKPVCCFDTNAGNCYENAPLAKCSNTQNSSFNLDATCNVVSQCQTGCCKIGSQFTLTSEGECKNKAKEMNIEFEEIFDSSITSESLCTEEGRKKDKGCCVNEDEICSLTTREECSTSAVTSENGSIGFFENTFCSDKSLSCGCEAKKRKGCIPGEDDVYWFDSCGNKEEIAEDCDYGKGTLCMEDGENAFCGSVDCKKTEDFKDKNTHDARIGGPRKNGEAWCIYESSVGGFLDRPGSRHYRHICINGKELTEPCRDFREEICVQGKTESFSQANCVVNDVDDDKQGSKVSTSPLGGEFWEGDGGGDCSEGESTCTVVYHKANTMSSFKCVANCECEEQKWLDDAALFCKSQGDCGADINILGVGTSGGLDVKWTGSAPGPKPDKVDPGKWGGYGVYGGYVKHLESLEEFGGGGIFGKIAGGISGIAGAFLLKAAVAATAIGAGAAAGSGVTGGIAGSVGGGVANLVGGGIAAIVVGAVLIVVAIAAIVFAILSMVGGETKKKTVTVTCNAWQAPSGVNDCDKCEDDTFKECSEYRCKSLGANCELVNEGTTEQKCVDIAPNDVNSPVISPWHEVLNENYTLAAEQYGYSIKPIFRPYEPVRFGIKTDELSTCKIDNNHTNSYDDMANFMDDGIFRKEHNITLNLPDGNDYVYYLRCSDKKGNKNTAEYSIRFGTEKGPDLTSPIIVRTDIVNGGFIPNAVTDLALTVYVNEPVECKWSKQDKEFEVMEQLMFCENERIENPTFFTNYECITMLNGLNKGEDNTFYFRCNDLSNNTNQESYVYTVKGTSPLQITSATPQGNLFVLNPEIKATTSGGIDGIAMCRYGLDKKDFNKLIEFFETGSNTHRQPLANLTARPYNYYILCRDQAGNEAESTVDFSIDLDVEGPNVVSVYVSNKVIHLILNEESTCEYSLEESFEFGKGKKMTGENTVEHSMSKESKRQYVLCKDKNGNMLPKIKVIS